MEEEAEKMAALKRAYADIILNTAKESAARVLAAERRALSFQQSLFATKEEAVATMLRLKALMEDKIREAEKKAVCQAKKIEELELQLGEAEDTIVDLREDLKRVREELIMIKNGSVQPSSEGNINDTCMVCNNIGKETSADNLNEPAGNMPIHCNNMITLSQKTAGSHHCCPQNDAERTEHPKEFSEIDCPGNADLAPFIWSKVPELYRKGYTQRIHALGHNLASKGPFGESNGLPSSSKSEPLTCSGEKIQIPCKIDSAMPDQRTTQVKDASMFEGTEEQSCCCKTVETGQEPGCSGKDHVKFSGGFSPRKLRTIYNQSNVFSNGIHSDKLKSCSSSSKFVARDKWNETEAPEETPEIGETSEEDEKSPANISTERGSLMLSQCRLDTSIKIEGMGVKQCTERRNCRDFQKQNQSVFVDKFLQNSSRNGEDAENPLLSRTYSNTDGHPSSVVVIQEDSEDRIEVAVASVAEAENIAENLDNCNTIKPDAKDTANGTGTDKFLKYTFQRKRKRGSSPIKNEIVFPEKKATLKPKSVEKKQNSVPVPSKSSAATDLPRNNRRLVQVARQLISLSEKRW